MIEKSKQILVLTSNQTIFLALIDREPFKKEN